MHLSFFFLQLLSLTLFLPLLPSLSVSTHPRKCDKLGPLNDYTRFRKEAEITSCKITSISSLVGHGQTCKKTQKQNKHNDGHER